MTTASADGTSVFKRAQQRHRRQGAAPNRTDDLSELVDFSNPSQDDRILPISCAGLNVKGQNDQMYNGPLYGVSSFPGLVYAPQALLDSVQLDLAYLSVSEYCERPHRTNIDLVPPKSTEQNNLDEAMWPLWKQKHGFLPTDISNKQKKKYRSFEKLSWSTMGYHYDWTARAYHEGAKSPVPPLLANLAAIFARTCMCITKESSGSFTGSACIVNYYHCKSIMGGHRDDLEFAFDKPVVSISLGLPAVFLLGGATKQDPVVPILARPGDVMMLGGDARLCYHGMARVLPSAVSIPKVSEKLACRPSINCWSDVEHSRDGSVAQGSKSSLVPDSDRAALKEYLSGHRININVRQVLPDGVHSIPELESKTEPRTIT